MTRIALIHALADSVDPVNDAMQVQWPDATRMNLLDDSLSADLARTGVLDDAMTQRFVTLSDYALGTGADAILFTCSAFGPCLDAVAKRHAHLPVLRPNEAMIEEAEKRIRHDGGKLGLLSTFAQTLISMPKEFAEDIPIETELAPGALAALQRGDAATHDELALQAAKRLVEKGCTVIALAQFSLARAETTVAQGTGLPVLTTVNSAINKLKKALKVSVSQ